MLSAWCPHRCKSTNVSRINPAVLVACDVTHVALRAAAGCRQSLMTPATASSVARIAGPRTDGANFAPALSYTVPLEQRALCRCGKRRTIVADQLAPERQLLFETHRHVRRRARRQDHRPVAVCGELRREFSGSLAVEADRFQFRAQHMQAREIVGGGLADGGIEAAFALASAEHVPQADVVGQQPGQALGIGQRIQVFANEGADQFPELVARIYDR